MPSLHRNFPYNHLSFSKSALIDILDWRKQSCKEKRRYLFGKFLLVLQIVLLPSSNLYLSKSYYRNLFVVFLIIWVNLTKKVLVIDVNVYRDIKNYNYEWSCQKQDQWFDRICSTLVLYNWYWLYLSLSWDIYFVSIND